MTNQDNDHNHDGNYQDNGEYWKSYRIIGHKKVDRYHNPHNVITAWGNGEISEVSINLFEQNAPNECARYAKENHSLDEPGLKQYRDNNEHHQPRNGFNDGEDRNNNDEHQSEDDNNYDNDIVDNDIVDNNNDYIFSYDKINNYCETVDSM